MHTVCELSTLTSHPGGLTGLERNSEKKCRRIELVMDFIKMNTFKLYSCLINITINIQTLNGVIWSLNKALYVSLLGLIILALGETLECTFEF